MTTKLTTDSFGEVMYNDFTTGSSSDVSTKWPFTKLVTTPFAVNSVNLNEMMGPVKEGNIKKGGAKMSSKKRGLYQVILVDPKAGKIIFNGFVICDKPEDVLLEADAGSKIKESQLTVSEVDKIINYLGEIRRVKKSKEGVLELVQDSENESN